MIPVNLDDVLEALTISQNVYKLGFRNASNLNPSYKSFGEDIRQLAINLDLLSNVLQRAHSHAGAPEKARQSSSPGFDNQVLGDLKGTISTCDILLNDQRHFQRSGGFVNNLCWYTHIEPEIAILSERITCHNIKLSILFSILDPCVLEDRSFYITDSTAYILSCAEDLGRSVHDENGANYSTGLSAGIIAIPRELESEFTKTTWQANLDFFTMDRGIDAAVIYFRKITMTSNEVISSDATYHVAIIHIMMAIWLLNTIRGSGGYHSAAKCPSSTAFARQLDDWGMTVERFFARFEAILQDALRRLLGRYLVLPPTPDLLAIFESQRLMGQRIQCQQFAQFQQTSQVQDGQMAPIEMEDTSIPRWEVDRVERGKKEMGVFLRSPDPDYTQTLQVFKHAETSSSLVLVKTPLGDGREKETTDNFELDKVQIIPVYAMRSWTAPPLEPQTMIFRTDYRAPFSRTLIFQQSKDMFDFQQKATGYRVVHDVLRVLTTLQESKLLGGSNRQDLCRVQLWSAPPPTEEVARQSSAPSSSSPDTKRMLQTSSSSSSSFGPQSKRRSTPSIFSMASRSSSPSIAIDAPSYAMASSSKESVYAAPVPPCVVLFAHKAPKLSERVEGREILRSFLVIDIGPGVTAEEEFNEQDEAVDSSSHCCVLERKSSYLQARRSLETSDPNQWDVATVGMYQREKETEVIKKVKHVILQFETRNDCTQFMTKFNQIKAVANIRLVKFIGATGGAKG